jgi:hypothetical protein
LPSITSRSTFGVHCSVRHFLAASRICFWSSEKSKFMAVYLSCVRVVYSPSFRGDAQHRTWNLEIPGSMLRIAPE